MCRSHIYSPVPSGEGLIVIFNYTGEYKDRHPIALGVSTLLLSVYLFAKVDLDLRVITTRYYVYQYRSLHLYYLTG